MSALNRHRRLVITAAGLAMSGALMVACGHARGERAMNTTAGESVATDSAMPTPSTANGAATSTSAATPVNPSGNDASSANAGGNATASASAATARAGTRNRARTDYSVSAVPSNKATTTTTATTRTRRHRRAAAAESPTPVISPNAAEPISGVSAGVSAANALPVGATCTPASVAVAISAQPSMDVSVSARADAANAKGLPGDSTVTKPVPPDRADTIAPITHQPYDVNRPISANIPAKPTPDTSMIPPAGVKANAAVSAGVSPTETGNLPPCGWPTGAKGAFLNDAQVAHAVLIANSVDSAAAVGILSRTQNSAVRDFAQMMLRDHTDANRQVAAIIDRTHIAPAENDISTGILRDTTGHIFASVAPSTRVMGQTVTPVTQPAAAAASYNAPKPMAQHVDTVTMAPTPATATPLSGDDKNYIDYMVQAHQQLLDAFDGRLIPFAWNPDLRSALEAMKPVVQRHLDRAREIQRGQTATNQ